MGHGHLVSFADRLADILEDRNFFLVKKKKRNCKMLIFTLMRNTSVTINPYQNLECVEVHLQHLAWMVALVGMVDERTYP